MNWTLLYIFLISFVVSSIINWIFIKFSVNLGVRNMPSEEIRWQKRKPSVGGISFFLVFIILFAILSNMILYHLLDNIVYEFNREISLVACATLGFFIGLIDDARNTNPLLKFSGQLFCGIVIVLFGIVIPVSPNLIWNSIITVFWVVFLMNSINMLDNMDGMTASISFYILGFICFYLVGHHYSNLSSIMILVCMGSVLGFLIYNWHPSKIYMGDSGSQFLGVILAHFSIQYLWGNRLEYGGYFQIHQFIIPLLLFTIPVYDTTTVFIHRLLRKQSPFIGGKDHLSHHFVFLGMKDYYAVSILGGIHILFSILGLWVIHRPQYIVFVLILWVIVFLGLQYFYVLAKSKIPNSTTQQSI